MRDGRLSEMVAFMSVVEAGSFVGGARRLGLSRSATGKAVARLEERLGTRLLNRSTRSLSLSVDGETFMTSCWQAMEAIDFAEASVRKSSGTPTGLVRMSVPTTYGRQFVLSVVSDYLTIWPNVHIDVNFTDRVVDMIEDGIDLTLRIGVPTTDQRQDTRLISRVIAHFKAVLCASPSYLNRCGVPVTLEDLDAHTCLTFASNMHRHVWRLQDDNGALVRVNARGRLGLDDGQAILEAALAGMGIAYLPSFCTDPHVVAGRLVKVLDGHGTEDVPIVAIYPSRTHLPTKTRYLIDHLVTRLGTARKRGSRRSIPANEGRTNSR